DSQSEATSAVSTASTIVPRGQMLHHTWTRPFIGPLSALSRRRWCQVDGDTGRLAAVPSNQTRSWPLLAECLPTLLVQPNRVLDSPDKRPNEEQEYELLLRFGSLKH
ncbi:unnamed protein product, partial [Symbiodinium microadriaticum]